MKWIQRRGIRDIRDIQLIKIGIKLIFRKSSGVFLSRDEHELWHIGIVIDYQ
jgi:hypothetical protein